MYYLHLKFDNCGLISCIKNPIQHLNRDAGELGKNFADEKSKGHNLENPIPYTLLSNVLHVLCGEIPVSSKRITLNVLTGQPLSRLNVLDDIARNSYIKYDYNIELNDKGFPKQSETFQTNKWNWNCVRNDVQTKFKLFDGSEKIVNGFYNWNYFKRSCNSNEEFYNMINFLNIIVKFDVLTKTLKETIFYVSKYWEDESTKEKINEFIKNNKSYIKPWLNVFFNIGGSGTNTYPEFKTPLFVNRGITNITFINGEIICPIEDENIVRAIYNGCGNATLLEDGIVYVLGIENYEPYPNFKETFEKIK